MLQPSEIAIERHAVLLLTVAEKNSKLEEEKYKLFLLILRKRVGTSKKPAGIGVSSNR